MARRRKSSKKSGSARCTCKVGVDGRKHCYRKTGKGIRGCKSR